MAYLLLVRHGVSEWNTLGKWTGHTDTDLTDEGRAEARRAAQALAHIPLDKAYTSDLRRAQQTLTEIQAELDQQLLETVVHPALKERDYGDFTGKNKWEVKEQVGEEQFLQIRRGWDTPIPNGESLKDVHARVVPYFEQHILADLKAGQNILISAHGNSLRALIKHLEQIADEDIHAHEIGTGEVFLYKFDDNGQVVNKEILLKNEKKV